MDLSKEFGIPVIPDAVNATQRKRKSIVDAAAAEFIREGYSAASVDSIASRAAVSKPTIYKHFGSKERLFLAVIGGILATTYSDLEPCNSRIAEADDLRTALIHLTSEWTELLLRDDIMSLRRLVIGEIDRFPQLGQLWYRVSYDMINAPLVVAIGEIHRRGRLDVPDPALAVRQLVALTAGVPQLMKTMQPTTAFDDAEVTRMVTSGVEVFLARYAVRQS